MTYHVFTGEVDKPLAEAANMNVCKDYIGMVIMNMKK
jgi:hypothetical protein